MTRMEELGKRAKDAARVLSVAGEKKSRGLLRAAMALREHAGDIIWVNETDMKAAKENSMSDAMQDRLLLTKDRIEDMAAAVEAVAGESDPVGRVLSGETRPNGLKIEKITVPLGVIGIIYESRPNVTSDAAALCIRAGNVVILRGGKEAFHSNKAIVETLRTAFAESGLPEDIVQLVEDTTRQSATDLMNLTDYLDVLIPRGGAGLIQAVKATAKVPVIETGVGNCHVYVDEYADIHMAADIIYYAKTSRPSVCNAIETVLVHEKAAAEILPLMKKKLDGKSVEIRGDERTAEILPGTVPATESDWYKEFLSYTLAVRVVATMEEALDHIAKYSSHHSEAIITRDNARAEQFLNEVDSAAVYVNASTRFTDGAQFGLGAEIGISTQKLHARGPMGLHELVSYKYLIRGNGQIR